jgi:hypothetical protein
LARAHIGHCRAQGTGHSAAGVAASSARCRTFGTHVYRCFWSAVAVSPCSVDGLSDGLACPAELALSLDRERRDARGLRCDWGRRGGLAGDQSLSICSRDTDLRRVAGAGCRVRMAGARCQVPGAGCRMPGAECRYRMPGAECRYRYRYRVPAAECRCRYRCGMPGAGRP